jgi:hypothetical protein
MDQLITEDPDSNSELSVQAKPINLQLFEETARSDKQERKTMISRYKKNIACLLAHPDTRDEALRVYFIVAQSQPGAVPQGGLARARDGKRGNVPVSGFPPTPGG